MPYKSAVNATFSYDSILITLINPFHSLVCYPFPCIGSTIEPKMFTFGFKSHLRASAPLLADKFRKYNIVWVLINIVSRN